MRAEELLEYTGEERSSRIILDSRGVMGVFRKVKEF